MKDKGLDKVRCQTNKKVRGKTVRWFGHENEILYRYFQSPRCNGGNVVKQVVVPGCLREQVMAVGHDSILAGHMGIHKTLSRVQLAFYWPGMDGDIKRYCRSCDVCQRTIPKGKVIKVPLGTMPIIETPFKRIGIDLVGPIAPVSERGYRYILTMVDYATRYPEAIPLRHISTEDVAEALLSIYSRVGFPDEVLSDLGTQFTSAVMTEINRLLSIKCLHSTPYHPICNGLVEKMNGVLKQMLKRLTVEKPRDWDRYINPLLFAYREVPQDSTGYAPFELLYGRDVKGPMSILKECWTNESVESETKNSYDYVLDLKTRITETCKLAHVELQKAQTRYRNQYNRKAKSRRYKIGDQVLLLLPTDNNKLLMQWKGPFKITDCKSPHNYALDINGRTKVFHVNMLKQYITRCPESRKITKTAMEVATAAIIECDETTDVANFDLSDNEFLGFSITEELSNSVEWQIDEKLTETQKTELMSIVTSFQDVFSDKPGITTLVEHHIDLNSDEPIRCKPYPLPYSMLDVVDKEIDAMFELDIIEPSESSYAAPIVLVRKKDGSNRFCADYRLLNRITIFDPEPMPQASDIYAKLKDAKFLSKIDLSKGFWQIAVHKPDRRKTAFVTPHRGCFQFKRMPFGLKNSPATFNRAMRRLLSGMDNVSSYIDDILIHTSTFTEHVATLRELLSRFRQAGLTAKPSKCMFGFEQLDYVGHVIGTGRVGVLPENIEKIKMAKRPLTKKAVRSFNGLVNYYRNHVPNLSQLLYPLTELTKKGQPNTVIWTEECEQAFLTLKEVLTSEPILQLPDLTKLFVVQVDASDNAVGAVLLQESDGILLPVAYASKKLTSAEQRYPIIEKECLAVVYAVHKFNKYLYGRHFVLQTDHSPLVAMRKNRIANDRIMRWSLLLQSYDMEIQYIRGSDNVIADYLSRSM